MKKIHLRILTLVLCVLLILGILIPCVAYASPAEKVATIGPQTESQIEVEEQVTYQPIPKENPAAGNCAVSESDIDRIANVVAHEVGGICGPDSYVIITYANGTSVTYRGSCILHQIHAQVLINQVNSSMFPDNYASCIRMYWASYLSEPGFYSQSNVNWNHCRKDVVDVLSGNAVTIPSNVYAATCDANLGALYPGYTLYASVYWDTGWYNGVFYYYQYNA